MSSSSAEAYLGMWVYVDFVIWARFRFGIETTFRIDPQHLTSSLAYPSSARIKLGPLDVPTTVILQRSHRH
jgi:hypothetical protein